MRNRLPSLVVLASALVFLASLFLPWRQQSPSRIGPGGALGLLNLFANGVNLEGWATSAGVAASLAALVLVAVAASALIRPTVVPRARYTPVALAMLYLAIGGVLVLRAEEKSYGRQLRFHSAYGMFLGLAAAGIALVAAVGLEASSMRRPGPHESLGALLGVGLLASALLPWASPFGPEHTLSFPGVALSVVVLSSAGVCAIVATALWSGTPLSAAVIVAVLTGAGVNAIPPETIRYGARIALGFASALVALAALTRREAPLIRPTVGAGLVAAAATLLVVSLFLPWQEICEPGSRCFATTGWGYAEPGAATGVLALALVFSVVAAGRFTASAGEVTLGISTLVAVLGASIGAPRFGPSLWHFGYGAYLGFAATGILLFIALSRVPPPRIGSRHALVCLVPLTAGLASFLAIALPPWSVLPSDWSQQADVLKGWYEVAGLLLAIHLMRRWLDRARRIPFPSEQLVVLPLALFALTALELIRNRSEGMTWGGGILAGLCLLLALLGRMELNGRLESFRIPEEIWRIDRLPGES